MTDHHLVLCVLNDDLGACIAIRPEACVCRQMLREDYDERRELIKWRKGKR